MVYKYKPYIPYIPVWVSMTAYSSHTPIPIYLWCIGSYIKPETFLDFEEFYAVLGSSLQKTLKLLQKKKKDDCLGFNLL